MTSITYSQNPLVKQWDKRFGGIGSERTSYSPVILSGTTLILSGTSESYSDGDKSQLNWGSQSNIKPDYWVVKLDSMGNKIWDQRYGGIGDESLDFCVGGNDGSVTLIGISNSPVSGDVSNINWTSNNDGGVWMIKVDAMGNKIWDKGYKTSGNDYISDFIITRDKGYLIGFSSKSGIGGLKSDTCRGFFDVWIVKLDSLGNKVWDKTFGGSEDDGASSIIELPDGGFLIGGGSSSLVSGDKTDEVSGTLLSGDMWLIKTDSVGNKIWDKEFGGEYGDYITSIEITSEGNYLLYGNSSSPVSGNKTAIPKDTSIGVDYWLVKVNPLGNIIWDKAYGGQYIEYSDYGNIVLDSDGGILLSGNSLSNAGGDKSENNFPNIGSNYQSWIIKCDSAGNKMWDKTVNIEKLLGGYANRYANMQLIKPGCFVLFSATNGGMLGEKSQLCWDTIGPSFEDDFWVVKYCDTLLLSNTHEIKIKKHNVFAFPNPSTSSIKIGFTTEAASLINMELFDNLGRSIKKLLDNISVENGTYYYELNFETEKIAPGIIFCKISTNTESYMLKLIYIKP